MKIIAITKSELTDQFLEKAAAIASEGFDYDSVALWKKRFNFWWTANPYLHDNIPACWVISDDVGNLFGFHANIPVLYQYGENKFLANGSGTYYVNPVARGPLSIALGIQPPRLHDTMLSIANTANSIARKIMVNCGYSMIPTENPKIYLIFNYHLLFGIFYQRFKTVSLSKNTIVHKYCYAISNILCHISRFESKIESLSKVEICNKNDNYKLEYVNDVCVFLKYLKLHNRTMTIEISHDKQTMNWILFSPEIVSLSNRQVIHIFSSSDTYCGYLIYDFKNSHIIIRDIDLLIFDTKIVDLLLKHLRSVARVNGILTITINNEYIHDSNIAEYLSTHTISRKTNSQTYVSLHKNSVSITIDEVYDTFRVSGLDPDGGFI